MNLMILRHPRSAINARESYKKEYICFRGFTDREVSAYNRTDA